MSKFLEQQATVQDTFDRVFREIHDLLKLYNINNTDYIMLASAVEKRIFERDITAYAVWQDLMELGIVDREYYENEFKKRKTPLWRILNGRS